MSDFIAYYVGVKFLHGFDKNFLYAVPYELKLSLQKDDLIQVPLRGAIYPAQVTVVYKKKPHWATFDIKNITDKALMPQDSYYALYMKTLANYLMVDQADLYKRLYSYLSLEKTVEFVSSDYNNVENLSDIVLTQEQERVVDSIYHDSMTGRPHVSLLHGVTGSGKTEVYKVLMQKMLLSNKTSIFLVPEISLAHIFYQKFLKFFGKEAVFSFHAGTRQSDKKKLWYILTQGLPVIIIGVHLPSILPVSNLGILIIDEEHEQSFQEKKSPYINHVEAMIWRSKLYNVPLLLGSATPSARSLYQVDQKKWSYFVIEKRFKGVFPIIQQVQIDREKYGVTRKYFPFTPQLVDAIKDRLAKKEQIMLYLNRRGYCFFIQCKYCKIIETCPDCSVSLTLHKDTVNNNIMQTMLRCHYCDYETKFDKKHCSSCHQPGALLQEKGIGTQQIVKHLSVLFPDARVMRADLDMSQKKQKEWYANLQDFYSGSIDIMVGTKTITKGFDIPNVTLVGVLWADLDIHMPTYDAEESSFQQLIQVAGRTGRGNKVGKVIVQYIRYHQLFDYINEMDYANFIRKKLITRKLLAYPPYYKFIMIELKSQDENIVQIESLRFTQYLIQHKLIKEKNTIVLGPTKPLVEKVNRYYIRQISIKTLSFYTVQTCIREHNTLNSNVHITYRMSN